MTIRASLIGLGLATVAAPVFAGGPVVPAPEPVVAPVVVATPAPSFAGGYVGAGIGYAFGGKDRAGIISNEGLTPRHAGDIELNGALANLHAGYRWQQPGSRMVYGVEAGVSGGDVKDDVSRNVGGVEYSAESELNWTASLKGTLGYTVRPDTLLYGFAGYTIGRSDYTMNVSDGRGRLDESRDLDGYVVGLGLERMLNDRWSVRGEYQYSNFGSDEMQSENGSYRTKDTPEYHTVRVGVNYRF